MALQYKQVDKFGKWCMLTISDRKCVRQKERSEIRVVLCWEECSCVVKMLIRLWVENEPATWHPASIAGGIYLFLFPHSSRSWVSFSFLPKGWQNESRGRGGGEVHICMQHMWLQLGGMLPQESLHNANYAIRFSSVSQACLYTPLACRACFAHGYIL